MAYSPQAKLGIVVLTNQYGNRVPMALYRWLFDAYLSHKHQKDWSTLLWQQKQRAIH